VAERQRPDLESNWWALPAAIAFIGIVAGAWLFLIASIGAASVFGEPATDAELRESALQYLLAGLSGSVGLFLGWWKSRSRWWLASAVLVLGYPVFGGLVLWERSLG
jgi:hypothetical protein